MKRFLPLAIFVVLVGALATPANASAPANPGVQGSPEAATAYWTAQRAQSAIPLDIVRDAGLQRGGPQLNAKAAATSNSTGTPWPDSSNDPVDDIVGKVLFTLGGSNYVCSASTVKSPSGSSNWVVLTAGHCTFDSSGYATNWVFVPDYEDVLQFGCDQGVSTCHAAASLHATNGWVSSGGNNLEFDVAFARMADPIPGFLSGVSLPAISTNNAIGVTATAFGYPAAKKYKGSDLIYCQGTTTSGPGRYSANAGLPCNMTGGSSGGPWYADFDGNRVAVSLNSFGLRGQNGVMFGPVFDSQTISAYNAAG